MKKILSQIYRFLFNLAATFLPIKNNLILFENYNGKIPGDNPLAIYNTLILDSNKNDLEIYWGIKKKYLKKAQERFPDIKFVVRFSILWLVISTRAKFWIFNSRMPLWLKKNKGTVYIQTWHGTPLKKLGLDIENISIPGTSNIIYRSEFVRESKRWNFLIAPNNYSKTIFKKAFDFQNEFLEIGYPRNDELIKYKSDDEYKMDIKRKILGDIKGRVILYAPTWRDDYFISKGNYKFNMAFELKKIFKILNMDDFLIIRPHYLVGDSIDITGFENRVLVSKDEDINSLYIISDILVTDYSSVMFDFAELQKPILFYAYDLEHYERKLRGFYLNYQKDLPGEVALTENEFYEKLSFLMNHTDQYTESFHIKYTNFRKTFCKESMESSQTVVDKILMLE